MLMLGADLVHLVVECYREILNEDFASAEDTCTVAGCDAVVALDRFKHGYAPMWGDTPGVRNNMYEMHAKDVHFGELKMHGLHVLRFKKYEDRIVNGDLLTACGVTNTFTKAENIIAKMISVKDPLITRFGSIQLEQNLLLKVRACFIHIIVRAINCYVLCQKDFQCCTMTFESSCTEQECVHMEHRGGHRILHRVFGARGSEGERARWCPCARWRGARRTRTARSEPLRGPGRARWRGAAGAGASTHYRKPAHRPHAGYCAEDDARDECIWGRDI